MSRTSRVPYHQNAYDLLGIEPGESPDAARRIAEREAKHGPLPASVREWYLAAHAFERPDPIVPLDGFLNQIPIATVTKDRGRWAYVALGGDSGEGWLVYLDAADPAVWSDGGDAEYEEAWSRTADRFSDFAFELLLAHVAAKAAFRPRRGLGLRTPDEPFQPPVIDFLTDHFGEPERTPRPHNVTTHTYRPLGGTIRVTADEPTLAGGLSAWWVHADTPEWLAEFAELLLPWGTLRDTLRADTDPARAVLKRVRGAG